MDPLIGTVNGGHVFPGATLPFGTIPLSTQVGDAANPSQAWPRRLRIAQEEKHKEVREVRKLSLKKY